MDMVDLEQYDASELSPAKLSDLIRSKKSFRINSITKMSHTIKLVSKTISACGFRSRFYISYRATAITAMVVPTGATQLAGMMAAIGIGLHNLVTLNPDYEVSKDYRNSRLTVTYMK